MRSFAKWCVVLIGGYIVLRYAWDGGTKYYFEQKCEAQGGEFIYKTVENVEGLLQIRLRDPKDFFDRLRKGDIPVDPYGHTNREAQKPQRMFINPPWSTFRFLESPIPKLERGDHPGAKYRRFSGYVQDQHSMDVEYVAELKSRYGFTWREVRTFWDKLFSVWGGELVVKDLTTDEVLGVRRGFFYRSFFGRRLTICPRDKDDKITYKFVSKVLMSPTPAMAEDKF